MFSVGSILAVAVLTFACWQHSSAGPILSVKELKEGPFWQSGGRQGQVIPLSEGTTTFGKVASSYASVKSSCFIRDVGRLLSCRKPGDTVSSKSIVGAFHKFLGGWRSIVVWNLDRGFVSAFVLYLALPLLLFYFGVFRFSKECLIYVLAVVGCSVVAYVLALKLYFPSRLVFYSGAVLVSQLYVVGFGTMLREKGLTSKASGVVGVICIGVASMIFSGAGPGWNVGLNTRVLPKYRELFEKISERSDPAEIFAGDLHIMDLLPLFAHRRVLISYEISHSFRRRALNEIYIPRLTALAEAYFADEVAPIKKLATEYGVKYVVVKRRHFEKEVYPEDFIFSPFAEIAEEAFMAGLGKWVLASPPEPAVVWQSSRYTIVDIDKLSDQEDTGNVEEAGSVISGVNTAPP